MASSWSTFLFEVANFVLLVGVLSWLFFKPVRSFVERREQEFAQQREQAEALRASASAELEDAHIVRQQANDLLVEQQRALEEHRQRELERVAAEIHKLEEAAHARVERELEAKRRSLRQAWSHDVVTWTTELTQRLLQRIHGPELHRALVLRACEELTVLRNREEIVDPVFELAQPLDDDEQERLAASAGIPRGRLVLRDVPQLIAGLRMVSAQGTIDASARGIAGHVERELSARMAIGEAEHVEAP